MSPGLDALVDRLRELRSAQWDPGVGLERVAPGAASGVDLAALGLDLHTVRESALGALADLADGRSERAAVTLAVVVDLQWSAPGRPWDGTFPITAEQPAPPEEGAVEWLDYDPNWRQFLGVVLAVVVDRHASSLPPDLVARLVAAVEACVRGEPDDRIPAWYTNPDLMHAWLLAWVGVRVDDSALVDRGLARAQRAADRVAEVGDVDEYSSPTYDGVDLLALGLWVAHPPTPAFATHGTGVLAAVGGRVAALFHPGLGAMCGPYIRAYGLGLDRYVSLVALWLVAAGAPVGSVLPWPLDAGTDHVHDLWFAPLVAALAPAVVPVLVLRDDLPRRHVQTFGPVVAESVLTATAALGAERGRRPDFARDQHVPVTLHTTAGWVAVAGDAGVDATIVDDTTVEATVDGVVVRTLWSAEPVDLVAGGVRLTASVPPSAVDVREDHPGWWAVLTFPSPPVLTLTVEP